MSFDVEAAGGWGTGALGDVTDPSGYINAYALIGHYKSANCFGVWVPGVSYHLFAGGYSHTKQGLYHEFEFPEGNPNHGNIIGTEILVVNTKMRQSGNYSEGLGKWKIYTITGATKEEVNGNRWFYFTVDGNIKDDFPDSALLADDRVTIYKNIYIAQAITIPHFRNLTLTSGKSIETLPMDTLPHVSDPNTVHSYIGNCEIGGYLAFKCSGTLTLEASAALDLYGHLNGANGSTNSSALTEANFNLDTALYSGCENSMLKDHLWLNGASEYNDAHNSCGTCFVMAKNIITAGTARIGNPNTYGVQYCRGAKDSKNKPSNVTNRGGCCIFIATQSWQGFSPAVIAKYRTMNSYEQSQGDGVHGRGLAAAYIALGMEDTSILPDEGLYSLDTLKDKSRLKKYCNVTGFGTGTQETNFRTNCCCNAYGKVTAISSDGKTYTFSRVSADVDELVDFDIGNMVMVHLLQKNAGVDTNNGRFFISRIVAKPSSSSVTLSSILFIPDLSKYYVQLVVIPQYTGIKIAGTYDKTPGWYNGAGGIFAVACNDNLDLTNAVIDLTGKGTFLDGNHITNPNKYMGNHQMKSRLPLGQGNGSAFILVNNLKMSAATRIGGTYSGANFGGNAVKKKTTSSTPTYTAQGGWSGVDGTVTNPDHEGYQGTAGHGGGGGKNTEDGANGGWFSNAPLTDDEANHKSGYQGAHIFIVADTITNFNLAAISTGGSGGGYYKGYTNHEQVKGGDGGAGYGGGGFPIVTGILESGFRYGGSGGYRGGGGSASRDSSLHIGGGGGGSCFIYCNNVISQTTTGIITD